MAASVAVHRTFTTWTALAILLGFEFVLSVATWLFMSNGSPFAPGVLVWVAWGLYPGVAAILAIRSRSEVAVTAVAMFVPAASLVAVLTPGSGTVARLGIPLAIATGVFLGVWVGSHLMRPGGRARSVGGMLAAGLVGGAATLALAFVPAGVPY